MSADKVSIMIKYIEYFDFKQYLITLFQIFEIPKITIPIFAIPNFAILIFANPDFYDSDFYNS